MLPEEVEAFRRRIEHEEPLRVLDHNAKALKLEHLEHASAIFRPPPPFERRAGPAFRSRLARDVGALRMGQLEVAHGPQRCAIHGYSGGGRAAGQVGDLADKRPAELQNLRRAEAKRELLQEWIFSV